MEMMKICVDEQPYVFWDWNLAEKNMQFLNGVDSEYFKYVAEINVDHLKTEHKHRAAMLLMAAYSQGLETLFALLCSATQAPQCVVGWMLSYKVIQLRNVVKKIHSQQPIYSRLKEKPVTWNLLAKFIHRYLSYDKPKKELIINETGKLWGRFADDFINEEIQDEYNSIKHGMRAKQGGFVLKIGLEENKGERVAEENMKTIGGSMYGSSYFTKEKIIHDDKINCRPKHHSRNWLPENIANRLVLLSMSINNVVNCLKVTNGKNAEECTFTVPSNIESFDDFWRSGCGVSHINFDTVIEPEHIRLFTKEDVLKSYAL